MVVLTSDPEISRGGGPLPLAAIPVKFVVLSLVQLITVPATPFGLVRLILAKGLPEQIVWLVAGFTFNVGVVFIVTITDELAVQPLSVSVIITE